MKSTLSSDLRKAFARLPKEIQEQAREAYKKFQISPDNPGLRFKRIHSSRDIYSIRISRGYRALGILRNDTITWYWIGSHAEYDQILKNI